MKLGFISSVEPKKKEERIAICVKNNMQKSKYVYLFLGVTIELFTGVFECIFLSIFITSYPMFNLSLYRVKFLLFVLFCYCIISALIASNKPCPIQFN